MGAGETPSDDTSSGLRSVASGASWYLFGRVVSSGLKLILQILLTRTLGIARYGIYTYAYSLVWLFVIVARLGTGKSLLRFIPEFKESRGKQSWVVAVAYGTALGTSIVFAGLLYLIAPVISSLTLDTVLLTDALRVFAIVLPFNTLVNLSNALFRAIDRIEYKILVDNVATPLVQILAVVGAAAMGASFIGVVGAIAASSLLLLGISVSILARKVPIDLTGPYEGDDLGGFYRFSVPLTLKDIGERVYSRSDILIIGFLLVSVDVGVYRAALLLMGLLKIPLAGLNQIFPSVASELHSNDKSEELERIYTVLTRWSFTVGTLPALSLIIYPGVVLSIFGEGFSTGADILILFAFAQLMNMAVGPSGFLLIMTDHQYISLLNQWTSAVLNVVANVYLILNFGFIGAAIATSGTMMLINVIRVTEVQYIERMNPYSARYWKPGLAGICSAIMMLIVKNTISGYPSLIAGSATGGIVFILVLYLAGFEEEDKQMVDDLIKPKLGSG